MLKFSKIYHLLILISYSIFMSSAYAENETDQVFVNNLSDVKQGSLLFKELSDQQSTSKTYLLAPHLKTDVHMQVTGMINRTSVTQHFTNTTDQWQEGIYVFPLPNEAAVDHMRMKIGDRIIEGQIKEKQEAKKTYEKAKQAGQHAALTEQERPNIFTTSVANIAPGQSIEIEIEYQETVNYDQGEFSLRFPMVVAPRYISGTTKVSGFAGSGWASNTNEVPDAERITPPVINPTSNMTVQRENRISLTIDLDIGLPVDSITSAYHAIKKSVTGINQFTITLATGDTIANKDFELSWKPIINDAPKAALFTQEKEQTDYAMMMLVPPEHHQARALNRDLVLVIDTSGSMAGESIEQAKAALELALGTLEATDRFNIIEFNSVTNSLFTSSQEATQSNLFSAIQFTRNLQADGGTEMQPALQLALGNQSDKQFVRQVIFLTDGSVGNEQALFELIERQLGQSRLFTIGIGSAPNSHFMQRAADYGRGTHTYIGNLSEVQGKMNKLFEKIENPMLRDIVISWPDQEIEIWPKRIPDLYLGEPLLITAKAKQLPEKLTVRGMIAGKQWQSEIALKGGQDQEGISVLWARKKIAALMASPRNAEFESIKKDITQTALDHHLVSKYTSLVAVDVTPVRPVDEALDSKAIPTHLAKGMQYNKVFGQKVQHAFPSTATDARFNLLVGLLMILLALILFPRQRHV